MSEPREPRTWRFWIGYYAIPRFALGALFLWMDWMPAFWALMGELVPSAAWFIKDEECQLLRRSREPLIKGVARMHAENLQLRELAWRRQEGAPVVSSICRPTVWPSAAWSWQGQPMSAKNSQEQQDGRKR